MVGVDEIGPAMLARSATARVAQSGSERSIADLVCARDGGDDALALDIAGRHLRWARTVGSGVGEAARRSIR